MNVRAKFIVYAITKNHWGGVEVEMQPQYDPDLAEDRSFSKATPTGKLVMEVQNPSALEVLELGREFYLDFTPVD